MWGGKDSTVLYDIIHNKMGYKNIPVVFVDVPTQYRELKTFTEENMDNVVILRPKISFVDVCKKYGFPLISKEISSIVNGAKKHYSKITDKYKYHYNRVLGKEEYAKDGKRHMYACTKYKPLLDAPFDVSSKCCDVMKKKPIKEYEKKSGRHGFLGTQATESRYREQSWLRNGCHLEKENRFQKLAQTHPQMIKLLDILENNGITYRQAIEYCNKNIKNYNVVLPNGIDK